MKQYILYICSFRLRRPTFSATSHLESLQAARSARIIILAAVICSLISNSAVSLVQSNNANAHFFGESEIVGEYVIVFAPFPKTPPVGYNASLNFSILKNGTNIFGPQVAVTVYDEAAGEYLEQWPYRTYEISDITLPVKFEKEGTYSVTLLARIADDEDYSAKPLESKFDLSVQASLEEDVIDWSRVGAVAAIVVGAVAGLVLLKKSRKQARKRTVRSRRNRK